MQSRRPAPWSWTFLAVTVALTAQGLALFNPDFVVVDCEERFNAAHGVALAQGHWDALFELQYRKFCGGCTFDAALAGLIFSVLPTTFGVWKLVPLAFTAAIMGVGFRGLWRLAGPTPAVIFAGLLCLAPATWVRLALLGWGNHYEAGLFCLTLALFAARSVQGPVPSDRTHLAVGVLCGFALWFGFSSTYGILTVMVWLLILGRHRGLGLVTLGLMLAPSLWVLQYLTTHQHPFGTIYTEGEAIPMLSRVPYKLWTLLEPRQSAGLFGIANPSVGIPLGMAGLASLGAASIRSALQLRRHGLRSAAPATVLWTALVAWTALYLVVDFRLEMRPRAEVSSAAGLRYAAPFIPVAWAFLALVAARWWETGKRRWSLALLAPFAATGLLTKVAIVGGDFPSTFAFHLDAPDHENYRFVHSYALDPRDHPTCAGADPDHLSAHAFAAGRHATLGVLGGDADLQALPAAVAPVLDFYAGVGQALVDHTDSDALGGLQLLEGVIEQVDTLPVAARQPALYEATWWRAFRDEPYGFARGAAGSATALTRLLQAARTVDPDLRDAALHSLGRRWGLVLGRWGQVGTIPFPAARVRPTDRPGLEAFSQGLGFGLGTKWGPVDTVPRPTGMPAELDRAYLKGLVLGARSQWTGHSTPTLSDLDHHGSPWSDAGAPRWWGPAPTMYCPCRASCW